MVSQKENFEESWECKEIEKYEFVEVTYERNTRIQNINVNSVK